MSAGGWLVVLDRAGRGARQFPLEAGRATLGSDPACDIRLPLPAVSAHHATVAVHCNQAIVRSVSERATLVNGAPVSAAALRHGDVIALGPRRLRWEYRLPALRRAAAAHAPLPGEQTALVRRVARARAPRRGSEPAPRDPIVPEHRASMPASTSGKQVAIVQPQRRGAAEQTATATADTPPPPAPAPSQPSSKRPRAARAAPSAPAYNPTTMATLWIESRKSSPRKSAAKHQAQDHTPPPTSAKAQAQMSPATPARAQPRARKALSAKKRTPLRMLVLRKAQSAHKPRVTKIQAPLKMDSTKQAAIMLMARHTPKGRSPGAVQTAGGRGPSYPLKGRSPLGRRGRGKRSGNSRGASENSYASVVEIMDSDSQSSLRDSSVTRRSGRSSARSPSLTNPRKSALKRPSGSRKSENIKFDLSNLDATRNRTSDDAAANETDIASRTVDSEAELTLRYSDSPKSPSPRISIHSRSSRMLESTLGSSIPSSPRLDRTPPSPSPRKKSVRGSIMLQKALDKSEGDVATYSRRTTRDQSWSTTVQSAHRSRRLSPRALESYSIVDLVSDSNDSLTSKSGSVYDSANSDVTVYDTPGKRARVVLYRTPMPGFSTPMGVAVEPPEYKMGGSAGARKDRRRVSNRSTADDANASVTTPENTEDATRNITLNSTRISRASKKRSQIVVDDPDEDSSPKSSRTIGKPSQTSPLTRSNISMNETMADTPPAAGGDHTPENQHSPVDASTPVLNIQSLLDASRHSNASPGSGGVRKSKRKTIGVLHSEVRRGGRAGLGSKSLSLRRSVRARDISANFDAREDGAHDDGAVTPTSAAKPVPEGVKNKHSSAKKPLSKRSLIDHLDESDIVKQLFNSPVKRKLSQSMTEFSRRHLLDDDFDRPRRPQRATVAGVGGSNDSSLMDHTERYTPDVFVSPLHTPSNSPNLSGVKRLFQKCTPDNDLRNVRGVKELLRTPRNRRSARNELSALSDVKAVFVRSPRNRLSDVRVKELFAASPRNDLGRVSGVKNLFRSQRKKGRSPRNELEDLRGVRNLFLEKSPANDLRNVSGVKRTLRRNSPRNDLSDVRGVKRMFRQEQPRSELGDLSGVQRLFDESAHYDTTFDQLLGRPPIRTVYTKAKSFIASGRVQKRGKRTKSKTTSLHDISMITDNVEEWVQNKLMEQLHKKAPADASVSKGRKSLNKSKNSSKMNLSRELQKLNTDTVNGSVPLIVSRTRNSSVLGNVPSDTRSFKKSASEVYGAHTLPIKKRSLVEASVNKSSNDRSHKLPIKKRAVVHSTPFKGTANITMNASEIGRMSPIALDRGAVQIDTIIGAQSQVSPRTKSPVKANSTARTSKKEQSVAIIKSSPKKTSPSKVKPSPKKTRSAKNKPPSKKSHSAELELSPKNAPTPQVILSPKKTRSGKLAQSSPAAAKTKRGAKTTKENPEMLNVKKRRSSIVIKKKSPVLSPQPASPKATRAQRANRDQTEVVSKPSPKKTRSNRAQKSRVSIEVKASPKNTRAKVTRTRVAVTKPSPKLNPRKTRNTQDKVVDSQPEAQLPTKRARKVTITEPESKDNKKTKLSPKEAQAEVQAKRQTRKAAVSDITVDRTVAEKSLSIVQTRRTRKTAAQTAQSDDTEEKTTAQNKKTRKGAQTKTAGTLKSIEAQSSVESATRGGRKTKPDVTVPELHKEETNSQNKITRNTQGKSKLGTSSTALKAIETQASVESVGRGGRKTKADVSAKAAKSKGRKTAAEKPASEQKAVKGSKTNAEGSRAQPTRGPNAKAVIAEDKKAETVELLPTRGRKRKNTDRDEPEIKDSVEKKQTRGKAKQGVDASDEGGRGARRGAGDSAGGTEAKAKSAAPGAAPRSRSAQAAAAPTPRGRRTASVATARLKRTNVEVSDAKEMKRPRRGAGGAGAGGAAPSAAAPARGGRARRR